MTLPTYSQRRRRIYEQEQSARDFHFEMSLPNPEMRRQVISLYKGRGDTSCRRHGSRSGLTSRAELLNLGRDYPQGYAYFRPRLHRAFMANAHLREEEAIRNCIARAEYVRKGE